MVKFGWILSALGAYLFGEYLRDGDIGNMAAGAVLITLGLGVIIWKDTKTFPPK